MPMTKNSGLIWVIFRDKIGELSCSRHGPCASKIIIFLADKDLTRVAQVKVVSMKFVRDFNKGLCTAGRTCKYEPQVLRMWQIWAWSAYLSQQQKHGE